MGFRLVWLAPVALLAGCNGQQGVAPGGRFVAPGPNAESNAYLVPQQFEDGPMGGEVADMTSPVALHAVASYDAVAGVFPPTAQPAPYQVYKVSPGLPSTPLVQPATMGQYPPPPQVGPNKNPIAQNSFDENVPGNSETAIGSTAGSAASAGAAHKMSAPKPEAKTAGTAAPAEASQKISAKKPKAKSPSGASQARPTVAPPHS